MRQIRLRFVVAAVVLALPGIQPVDRSIHRPLELLRIVPDEDPGRLVDKVFDLTGRPRADITELSVPTPDTDIDLDLAEAFARNGQLVDIHRLFVPMMFSRSNVQPRMTILLCGFARKCVMHTVCEE